MQQGNDIGGLLLEALRTRVTKGPPCTNQVVYRRIERGAAMVEAKRAK